MAKLALCALGRVEVLLPMLPLVLLQLLLHLLHLKWPLMLLQLKWPLMVLQLQGSNNQSMSSGVDTGDSGGRIMVQQRLVAVSS